MRRVISASVAMALIMAACTDAESVPANTAPTTLSASEQTAATTAFDPRHPVIFDYSPTVSDIGALAFLATRPELRLLAVTLPGTGESHCEQGVAHTRGMLVDLGYPEIPVACGPEEPTTGFNAFPTSWRVAADEMDLPEADPNETRSAPDLISDLVRGSEVPVQIVAVGPLTNLAVAFEADPGLAGQVAGVTIMGGAVDVPGNITKNPRAEWNIWVDPTAADVVFHSGAPVTLIPLDATNFLPAGRIFWEALDAVAATPAATLVRDVWAENGDWMDNPGGFLYFWDELAAAVLVDESLVTFETRTLVVDDDTRENKGWTREDPAGGTVRVAVYADRRAFERLFLDTLVGAPTPMGYLEASPTEVEYFAEVERITAEFEQALDGVFTAVAFELDLSEGEIADDAFLDLLVAALPRIFDGPWADQVNALRAVAAPRSLSDAHADWVDAMVALDAARMDMMDVLRRGDTSLLEPFFSPVDEACLGVQTAADVRMVVVHLNCG